MQAVPSPFTLSHYRYILQSALESGYQFISFSSLQTSRLPTAPTCLLRHDCDNDLVAALQTATIEAELGIQSTYFLMLRSAIYNLLAAPCTQLVKQIVAQGHWLGLHFDERFYSDASPEELSNLVDRERSWLSSEFGIPVDVVSFHQPSDLVLKNQIKLTCLNTYNKQDMAGIHYLSDSNMKWAEGCPSKIFRDRKYNHLQLLLHPEWWTPIEMSMENKWRQMLSHQFDLMQASLLQREATYNTAQKIVFDDLQNFESIC